MWLKEFSLRTKLNTYEAIKRLAEDTSVESLYCGMSKKITADDDDCSARWIYCWSPVQVLSVVLVTYTVIQYQRNVRLLLAFLTILLTFELRTCIEQMATMFSRRVTTSK